MIKAETVERVYTGYLLENKKAKKFSFIKHRQDR